MNRAKEKGHRQKPTECPSEVSEKRIDTLRFEIKSSKNKLDEYIDNVNNKVTKIVSSRLNKFKVIHEQIVGGKDMEIKQLEEDKQKMKQSLLNQNLQKLERTINYFEEEIERVTKIKEIFKKSNERLKIDLQIKQKQLQACKDREKRLIKQIWILEQDVKDIYSQDEIISKKESKKQIQNKKYIKASPKTISNQKRDIESRKIQIQNCRKVNTQPVALTQEDSKLIYQIQNKYLNYKSNLHQGWTKLRERLNYSTRTHKQKEIKYSPIHKGLNSKMPPQLIPLISQKIHQFNIYDDLRQNLRKNSRTNVQSRLRYTDQEQKKVGLQEFRLIAVEGPSIMKQIQKVVIESYGQLKQVDQFSIQLLSALFRNENAIKILEIVLFNYSVEAINRIKDNKNNLVVQKEYDRPSLDNTYEITPIKIKSNRHKAELQIRQKFKNVASNRKSELYQTRQIEDG